VDLKVHLKVHALVHLLTRNKVILDWMDFWELILFISKAHQNAGNKNLI